MMPFSRKKFMHKVSSSYFTIRFTTNRLKCEPNNQFSVLADFVCCHCLLNKGFCEHLKLFHQLTCFFEIVCALPFLCFQALALYACNFHCLVHGLRTPRQEISFIALPKIHSHSQIFMYGQSIFCLPHRPNFSDIFDLLGVRSRWSCLSCLHTWQANWYYHFSREMAQGSSFQECFCFLDILLLCTVCSCTQWQCVGASNTNDSSLSHALSSHYSILLHIGNEVLLFFSVSLNLHERFDEIFLCLHLHLYGQKVF